MKKTGLDRFLNTPIFIILGSFFFIVGIYNIFSTGGSNGLYALIMNFLSPPVEGPVVQEVFVGSGMQELILYFLPAVLVLFGTLIFARRNPLVSYALAVVVAIYLVVIHVKILFFNLNFGGCYYPDFFTASIFLWVPGILILVNSLIHKKSLLPIIGSLFFMISILLLALNYTSLEYLIGYLLLFAILVSWIGLRIEKSPVLIANFLITSSYVGYFWLRKFVINPRPEYLTLYITFSILFYLLFYFVVIIASGKKDKPLHNLIHLSLTGANLFFLLGTNAYALLHTYPAIYLGLFVTGLALFHLVVLFLMKRKNYSGWILPHFLALMFLLSLALPLLVQQFRVFIFSASLSVLTLYYSLRFRSRTPFGLSVLSLMVMFSYFLFAWIFTLIPTIFTISQLPDPSLLVYGSLMGLIVVGALLFNSNKLQKAEFPPLPTWFGKRRYEIIVRSALFYTIFMTLGWLMFMINCLSTGSADYTSVAWFISGTIFFTGMIKFYAGKKSSFKKPFLYLALGFLFLYPILVHMNMVLYRTTMIIHGTNGFILFIHYLSLLMTVILGRMVYNRIRRHHFKKLSILRTLDVVTILFILFLLCTEYDNLTVILSIFQQVPASRVIVGEDTLTSNMLLPYSIITWILAVVVLIRAMRAGNLFLRNFSIVLFTGMLVKLFTFDFENLSESSRSIMLFLVGLFLIGFAFIYKRLLKGQPILPEIKRLGEG